MVGGEGVGVEADVADGALEGGGGTGADGEGFGVTQVEVALGGHVGGVGEFAVDEEFEVAGGADGGDVGPVGGDVVFVAGDDAGLAGEDAAGGFVGVEILSAGL